MIMSQLDELIANFQKKIDKLEIKKLRYSNEEDKYSWHIVNDEQEIWKQAKGLAKFHKLDIKIPKL